MFRFTQEPSSGSHYQSNVKQSHYRPGVTQRVLGNYGSQITWQRHRMVVRLSALRIARFYPQEMLLVLISVRGWVDTAGVAQHLNHCANSVPSHDQYLAKSTNLYRTDTHSWTRFVILAKYWLRCCATNRKVASSIPACVIGIFHWHKILLIALWSWGRLSL